VVKSIKNNLALATPEPYQHLYYLATYTSISTIFKNETLAITN